MKETVQTYLFGDIEDFNQYSFDDEIPVGIYDDWKICIAVFAEIKITAPASTGTVNWKKHTSICFFW